MGTSSGREDVSKCDLRGRAKIGGEESGGEEMSYLIHVREEPLVFIEDLLFEWRDA